MAERLADSELIKGKIEEFRGSGRVNGFLTAIFTDWVDMDLAVMNENRQGDEIVWAPVNADKSIKIGLKKGSDAEGLSLLVDHNIRRGGDYAHFTIKIHRGLDLSEQSMFPVVQQAEAIPAVSQWTGNAYRAVGNLIDAIRNGLANMAKDPS